MKPTFLSSSCAVLVAAMLYSGNPAAAAEAQSCNMRLRIQLTPDVPDPRDAGFLSSLLSNEVGYRLIFRNSRDDTHIVADLIGPGPQYSCQEAMDTVRRDGRVLSVHAS